MLLALSQISDERKECLDELKELLAEQRENFEQVRTSWLPCANITR